MHVDEEFRQAGMINTFRKQRGYLPTLFGRPWLLEEVLPAGFLRSMQLYLQRADDRGVSDAYVNLGQTPEYCPDLPQVVPTLLRGSYIMSLTQRQLFEYPEYLVAMGISNPLLRGQGILSVAEFPAVMLGIGSSLILQGVTGRQVTALCGNGMHLAMPGICLLFILGHMPHSVPTASAPEGIDASHVE